MGDFPGHVWLPESKFKDVKQFIQFTQLQFWWSNRQDIRMVKSARLMLQPPLFVAEITIFAASIALFDRLNHNFSSLNHHFWWLNHHFSWWNPHLWWFLMVKNHHFPNGQGHQTSEDRQVTAAHRRTLGQGGHGGSGGSGHEGPLIFTGRFSLMVMVKNSYNYGNYIISHC